MEDIICTVPVACGDRDCLVGWHREHYWIYDDGTYSVCDDDGDHNYCEESEVPSFEEERARWVEYSKHVAETGEDPLREFTVRRTIRVRQRWDFRFNRSIIGAMLVEARHNHKTYSWHSLPDHVKAYLGITTSAKCQDYATWEEFKAAVDQHNPEQKVKPLTWWTAYIDYDRPRRATTIKSELRTLARRHLNQPG